MDNFQAQDLQPDMLAQQLVDIGYLPPHMNIERMAMMRESSFMAPTLGREDSSMDASIMAAFDENDLLNARRSTSYSSSSAQSQSSPLQNYFSGVDLPQLQTFTNPFTNSLEQISPVTAASSSRRDSDDECQRAEVSRYTICPNIP